MKKLTAMAAIFLMAGAAAMAITWNGDSNIAKGASVVVSTKAGEAARITDGDKGSRWQAVGKANSVANDWVLVDLGEVKTFTDIEVAWEASNAAAYEIYVSENEIPYTATTINLGTEEAPNNIDANAIDAEWLAANEPVVTKTVPTEETNKSVEHDFTFEEALSARYILVYCTDYFSNAKGYGSSIFEISVGTIENRNDIASVSLNEATMVKGGKADVQISALTTVGEAFDLSKADNIELTCEVPQNVTIEKDATVPGLFHVTGNNVCRVSLIAKVTVGDRTVEARNWVNVTFDWNGIPNVATNKTVTARTNADTEVTNPASYAVDGNTDTYYQYNGAWEGGDAWIIVDLGTTYKVSAVGFLSNANGFATIAYSNEAEPAMPEADAVWTDASLEGWTYLQNKDRIANTINTTEFAEPVLARYIAIRDGSNPNGKPQVKEIYVAGEAMEASVATSIKLSTKENALFVGESTELTCNVFDQYNSIMTTETAPVITVTGATLEGNTLTATDRNVTVKATYGELSAELTLACADKDYYCAGGAAVTSDTKPDGQDGEKAVDGGADPNANGALYVVVDNGTEPAGAAEHWIVADLGNHYDIDMILTRWEGAYPAKFDVLTSEDGENYTLLASASAKDNLNNRFGGKTIENVRYVKIATHENGTVWGIKLQDLKVYGALRDEMTLETDINNIATDEQVTLIAKAGETILKGAKYTVDGVAIEGDSFNFAALGNKGLSDHAIKAEYAGKSAETTVTTVTDHEKYSLKPWLYVSVNDEETGTTFAPGAELNHTFAAGEVLHILLNQGNTAEDYDVNLLILEWDTPTDYKLEKGRVDYQDAEKGGMFLVADVKHTDAPEGAHTDRVTHYVAPKQIENDDVPVVLRAQTMGRGDMRNVKVFDITPATAGATLKGVKMYATDDTEIETGVNTITVDGNATVDVYNAAGVLVRKGVAAAEALNGLENGVYIVNGKKVVK